MSDHAGRQRPVGADLSVLVVEDDPTVRALLCLVLETEGYCTRTAADGAEALREIRRARPRMLVLDLDLPNVPGERVVSLVRAWHGKTVSIVAVSAAVDGHRRASAAGADGYLSKPFDVDVLVSHVAQALSA